MLTQRHVTAKIFERLPNLRLLEIICAREILLYATEEVIREESKCGKCRHLHLCQGNALEELQILEDGKHRHTFNAHVPNREVAEWFDYKSSGWTVSFDFPPSFGSNFLGFALWVVYTCEATDSYYYE